MSLKGFFSRKCKDKINISDSFQIFRVTLWSVWSKLKCHADIQNDSLYDFRVFAFSVYVYVAKALWPPFFKGWSDTTKAPYEFPYDSVLLMCKNGICAWVNTRIWMAILIQIYIPPKPFIYTSSYADDSYQQRLLIQGVIHSWQPASACRPLSLDQNSLWY